MDFDSINQFKNHVEKQNLTSKESSATPVKKSEENIQVLQAEKPVEQIVSEEVKRAEDTSSEVKEIKETAENVDKSVSSSDEISDDRSQAETERETPAVSDDDIENGEGLNRVPRKGADTPAPSRVFTEDMFGGLMYYGEDLSYHMNDISKPMRPYVSEMLFKGAKAYMAYSKGNLIDRMNQGQFLAYLLIKTFPPEIRNVIIKEMPPQNGNDIVLTQLKEDEVRESSPATLANIATSVQEISDQMRLMLDADLSRDESMGTYLPAILYAATWLLTDRMDLRQNVAPRLSFNEYLNGEQTVPPNTDSVLRAGEGLQRRLDQKNNDARSGNIFRKKANRK